MNGDTKTALPDRDLLHVESEIVAPEDHGEFDGAFLGKLERAVDIYKRAIAVAIKLTNPWDWSDLGGKPYLGTEGCEKIAGPFGVTMGIPTRERLERQGQDGKPYYIWVLSAQFTSTRMGRSIVALGKCSSRDQFFGKDEGGYKEIDEVKEEDVIQASYSNLFGNGVKRLLGIRNLTWEQLAAGGIAQEKVGKVAFRKGGHGGGQSDAASSGDFVSSKQIGLILARCAAARLDPKALLDHLEVMQLSKDINRIPWKRMEEVLGWIATKQRGESLDA